LRDFGDLSSVVGVWGALADAHAEMSQLVVCPRVTPSLLCVTPRACAAPPCMLSSRGALPGNPQRGLGAVFLPSAYDSACGQPGSLVAGVLPLVIAPHRSAPPLYRTARSSVFLPATYSPPSYHGLAPGLAAALLPRPVRILPPLAAAASATWLLPAAGVAPSVTGTKAARGRAAAEQSAGANAGLISGMPTLALSPWSISGGSASSFAAHARPSPLPALGAGALVGESGKLMALFGLLSRTGGGSLALVYVQSDGLREMTARALASRGIPNAQLPSARSSGTHGARELTARVNVALAKLRDHLDRHSTSQGRVGSSAPMLSRPPVVLLLSPVPVPGMSPLQLGAPAAPAASQSGGARSLPAPSTAVFVDLTFAPPPPHASLASAASAAANGRGGRGGLGGPVAASAEVAEANGSIAPFEAVRALAHALDGAAVMTAKVPRVFYLATTYLPASSSQLPDAVAAAVFAGSPDPKRSLEEQTLHLMLHRTWSGNPTALALADGASNGHSAAVGGLNGGGQRGYDAELRERSMTLLAGEKARAVEDQQLQARTRKRSLEQGTHHHTAAKRNRDAAGKDV